MSPASQVIAQLRALGQPFTPAQMVATREILAPRVARPDASRCAVQRDVAYGPDARHRLDVFVPVGASAAALRPVFVFVHGGGFVQGDKGTADAPFYNNVGAWAVAQGFVGVTMTYRLAPAHPWPAGSADIDRAIAWLHANIAAQGGDPQRIVLCGQSAGAVHVAGYLARHGSPAQSPLQVAAAVLVSGIYDLSLVHSSPMHEAYYGADRSSDAARSTLPALVAARLPCLYVICENDPVEFQRQAARVVEACFAQRQQWPHYVYLDGHNHLSSVLQVGSDVDTLGPQMAQFMAQHVGVPT